MTASPTRTLLAGFLSVGALGFLLDVSVFQALFMFGYGPIAARIVSAGAAITLTWYLNRLKPAAAALSTPATWLFNPQDSS
jgi:putative flippase GtrA